MASAPELLEQAKLLSAPERRWLLTELSRTLDEARLAPVPPRAVIIEEDVRNYEQPRASFAPTARAGRTQRHAFTYADEA